VGNEAEWLLRLEGDTSGAKSMDAELDKFESTLEGTDRALKKTERGFRGLGAAAEKSGGGLRAFASETLAHFTALASFEGLKLLGEGIIHLSEQAFDAAGQAERTRRSFEAFMGVETADDLLAFMDHLAKYTEFTDGALKGFAGSLKRAGFAGEGLERALAATIDLAAQAPDKMAGAAEALGLLNKIKLKGGITERELVSAGISPEKFFKRLAGDLGEGVKTVEKQLSEGKIKADVLLEALYTGIAEKTGKPLGGAGVALSDTFLAKLEKTKDIIPNLFEELERSGGLKGVTEGLGKLVENLDPDSPAGSKIVNGLTLMLDKFGKFVSEIDVDSAASKTVQALDDIAAAAKVTADAIDILLNAFHGLRIGYNLLTGSREGVEKGSILGNIFDTADARKSGNQGLDQMADVIAGGGPIEKYLRGAAASLGGKVARGLGLGMKDGKKDVAAAAETLGTTAEEGLMSTLEMHSPSRVFQRLGELSTKGYSLGIRDGTPDMHDEISGAFSAGAALAARGDDASGARGSGDITIPITVNVGAAPGGEYAARETGEAIADAVYGKVMRLFETMRLQGAGA
jgi:hypothetical protein